MEYKYYSNVFSPMNDFDIHSNASQKCHLWNTIIF